MDLEMYVTNVTIDRTMSDEGIWLENQMKRFRQKRNVIARAEVLDATSDPTRINLQGSLEFFAAKTHLAPMNKWF